jgi:hypothetical protein
VPISPYTTPIEPSVRVQKLAVELAAAGCVVSVLNTHASCANNDQNAFSPQFVRLRGCRSLAREI